LPRVLKVEVLVYIKYVAKTPIIFNRSQSSNHNVLQKTSPTTPEPNMIRSLKSD